MRYDLESVIWMCQWNVRPQWPKCNSSTCSLVSYFWCLPRIVGLLTTHFCWTGQFGLTPKFARVLLSSSVYLPLPPAAQPSRVVIHINTANYSDSDCRKLHKRHLVCGKILVPWFDRWMVQQVVAQGIQKECHGPEKKKRKSRSYAVKWGDGFTS